MSITSGIGLHPDCQAAVTQLSMKKSLANKDKAQYRYIIFDFENNYEQVVVLKTGEEAHGKTPKEEYEDFLGAWTAPNLSSLAVYDMPYTTKAGALHSTPILLHYNADNSSSNITRMMERIKRRMIAVNTLEVMRRTFKVGLVMSEETESDLEYDLVLKQLEK
ncbi:hypothetical protein PILCRDRAFT_813430 [Piloderma croceum F 1598]|uniref:Cofilin n=1 Tax=Piloderma croceum (strain F 1598) TaxID=765440 RepID=A0A0C3BSI9_PILCF|nr:hypothetical protein PILCRDRAFT_813430 [Piloderma croceum F 1598]